MLRLEVSNEGGRGWAFRVAPWPLAGMAQGPEGAANLDARIKPAEKVPGVAVAHGHLKLCSVRVNRPELRAEEFLGRPFCWVCWV